MREILENRLWIGNARDLRDSSCWLELDIQAVVDLAREEAPCRSPRETISFRIPLLDGSGNPEELLRLAVQTTAGLLRERTPTLVCCSAGMSRSPAIVAASLSVIQNRAAEDCLQEIAANCSIDVSPVLWNDLVRAIQGSIH